jgi:hypothetical protein
VQSPAEAGRHRLRDLHLAPGSTSLALSPTPDSNRYDLVGSEACWPLNISRAGPRELRPRGRRGAPRPLLVHQLGTTSSWSPARGRGEGAVASLLRAPDARDWGHEDASSGTERASPRNRTPI